MSSSQTINFTYNSDGSRTEIDYPNGISQCLGYDDAQRLVSVVGQTVPCGNSGATILTSFSYSYANGSNDSNLRHSMTAQYPSGSPTTTYYCYDGLSRLTSADTTSSSCPNASASYRYAYDVNGNRTSATTPTTGTVSFTYNGANQLDGTNYSFDLNGAQTKDASTFSSASYNTVGQMSSITPTGGSAISEGYQGIGQAARVSSGGLTYTNSSLGINAETGGTGTWFTTTPDGTNLGERQSGNHYYFLFDGLGSVTAVTNSSGTVVKTYKYDPYGTTTVASGTLYEPITYAGGYQDTRSTNTGPNLIKFGERYYDPTIGRWTTTDPADNPLDQHGWNQYNYAGDDPINFTDPSGACILCSHPFGVTPRGALESVATTAAGTIGFVAGTALCGGDVVCGVLAASLAAGAERGLVDRYVNHESTQRAARHALLSGAFGALGGGRAAAFPSTRASYLIGRLIGR